MKKLISVILVVLAIIMFYLSYTIGALPPGITGVGFGEGRQKFGFLPEVHNDFIFATQRSC